MNMTITLISLCDVHTESDSHSQCHSDGSCIHTCLIIYYNKTMAMSMMKT